MPVGNFSRQAFFYQNSITVPLVLRKLTVSPIQPLFSGDYMKELTFIGGAFMEQQKIIDEIHYYKVQVITELLYARGMITFDEYDKLTELNRQIFSPLYADLLPKSLEKSSK